MAIFSRVVILENHPHHIHHCTDILFHLQYSDGRLVIDFVAESLSLPFLPPYRDPKADKTYGVNFAVAGSTAIRRRVKSVPMTTCIALHLLFHQTLFNTLPPEVSLVFTDYWNAYSTIVRGANKYGFKEVFKSCCGSGGGKLNFDVFNTCGSPSSSSCPDPSQYINWDGVHLTEAMYRLWLTCFLMGHFVTPI
ncbi:hypothetical protein HAX54_009558 [Datura stramonium]|uniref:Uncharacterized protein n=1 Tax=Datura stramonium TaxID=4076 RepID=A0ABS8RWD7_DATST|nr:hypothetical protein [Datura stramonium]